MKLLVELHLSVYTQQWCSSVHSTTMSPSPVKQTGVSLHWLLLPSVILLSSFQADSSCHHSEWDSWTDSSWEMQIKPGAAGCIRWWFVFFLLYLWHYGLLLVSSCYKLLFSYWNKPFRRCIAETHALVVAHAHNLFEHFYQNTIIWKQRGSNLSLHNLKLSVQSHTQLRHNRCTSCVAETLHTLCPLISKCLKTSHDDHRWLHLEITLIMQDIFIVPFAYCTCNQSCSYLNHVYWPFTFFTTNNWPQQP